MIFAKKNLAHRAWLIHELTHVWQRQQGICVFWRALFNRRYRYRLKADKSFWRYGVEQQARMVEDFYIRCERGEDCTAWRQCIPFLADLSDLSNLPSTTNHDNDAKT
ncbi:hypothetical protein [Moraxella marmotae]|uniref:hypothetical protein n=1 Tax=Moraxella marmotae TaxID=3344520 RepID=UPI0035F4205F